MKKTFVVTLAALFVLSIAGTAFAAANPFVDVPAKHWSYDAVAKLAKAGIVDGYGDGTFRGDKTMTRYEMAQIVAKAMAKSDKADAETKALVDKLAVEFAAELNNLGVRVAKLEKNQSSIKITGDARIRWVGNGSDYVKQDATWASDNGVWGERFRINMNAQVNENTSFYGRVIAMDHNEMGTTTKENLYISDAAFTTKNPFGLGVDATVGRFSQKFGQTGYWMDSTGRIDGAKVSFGKVLKVTAGFANFDANTDMNDAAFVEATYPVSKAVTVSGMYVKETGNDNFDVYGGGVKAKLNKDFTFLGDYVVNTAQDGDPAMYVGRLAYKGADKNKPQSWGFHVEYRKFEPGVYAGETGAMIPVGTAVKTNDGKTVLGDLGVKGFAAQYSVTLAKNIVFDAIYAWDDKTVVGDVKKGDFSRLQINYFF
ncbi:S-layer homology domain-containing protein [Sporolituus thermophilus]|uniref:S-layer homology domain-containing protein n=1 Tax=Sporolituus thermophilus DSM 23256 TaxID=1123285 RepID=A0A1G7NEY5_9FIRM|nr:S-layer homology domain-containing protein [Sporolituus thermophilus]SDF72604.1 S-layer homology domain-containing protein [Sporolituus thermophilus DSM 23256]